MLAALALPSGLVPQIAGFHPESLVQWVRDVVVQSLIYV